MSMSSRSSIKAIVIAGVCGLTVALSPVAAATPFVTGGYECLQTSSGEVGAPAATGAGAAGGGAACAPLTDMSGGVPMAFPGPPPAIVPPVPVGVPPVPVGVPPVPVGVPPVPVGVPPVPVGVPPVPVGVPPVPVGAPVPVGGPVVAPLVDMSGTFGGKGAPTGPPPAGAPVAGQPTMPGPTR